jgi:hypothetical protein
MSSVLHIANSLHSMQSEGDANHFVSIGINFGILMLCIFPTWVVLSELEHSHEVRVTEGEVVDKVSEEQDAGVTK